MTREEHIYEASKAYSEYEYDQTNYENGFIAGYNMAAKEYGEVINKGYKKVFTELPGKLEKQLEDNEVELSYDGYMHSYPDWFIRKKAAYIALRDALRQCEEFIDNIKTII